MIGAVLLITSLFSQLLTDSWPLLDAARHRSVPVAVYSDATPRGRQKPVIISHGYGGKNTDYSFIATHLAARGYYVVSIQHEIAGDAPLPTSGPPYETRMPSWQRGVDNILFVLDELKQRKPDLDFSEVVLIGHSHGGDTSMLFAREHPERVRTVVSLDNRRMPIPRLAQPHLYSIRSSDQPADPGVLPTQEEQRRFGITVVALPATIHNDMWDGGTAAQKAEITSLLDRFLRD